MEKIKSNFFPALKLILKFSFSFAILFYMVQSGRLDLSVVKRGFSHIPFLLGSIGLVLFALIISLYRWGLLMRGQGIEFTPLQLARYGMIGAFFNTTMPGAVSGDLIKAWYVLSDHPGQKKTPVLTSVLLDRILGVFGLVIVSASPLFLNWEVVWSIPELHKVALGVLALFLSVVLFFSYIMLSMWGPLASLRKKMEGLNRNRLGEVVLQAYDAWTSYREKPMLLAQAIFFSAICHLSIVMVVILCAQALGDNQMATYQYFLLVPIGLLTTAIPIAPAGLGVGHVAFAALFGLAGSSHGAEVFTMLVSLQILLNLSGVFFYLRSPKIEPQVLAST